MSAIFIGSLVTHDPFLPDNPGLVPPLVAALDWHWLFIPGLIILNLYRLLLRIPLALVRASKLRGQRRRRPRLWFDVRRGSHGVSGEPVSLSLLLFVFLLLGGFATVG
jgi:hypothetical protein